MTKQLIFKTLADIQHLLYIHIQLNCNPNYYFVEKLIVTLSGCPKKRIFVKK